MSNEDRKQINVRLQQELYNFLVEYARQNYKTVTAVIREMIAELYRKHGRGKSKNEDDGAKTQNGQ